MSKRGYEKVAHKRTEGGISNSNQLCIIDLHLIFLLKKGKVAPKSRKVDSGKCVVRDYILNLSTEK